MGYNKHPEIKIKGDNQTFCGFDALKNELLRGVDINGCIVIDCYIGIDVVSFLEKLGIEKATVFYSDDCVIEKAEVEKKARPYVTEDRLFGRRNDCQLKDFFDSDKLCTMRDAIAGTAGHKIVIGVGALLVIQGDVSVHLSISRWELQLRYRKGLSNWHVDNAQEDPLTKFKRGYFLEWRMADQHKVEQLAKCDYIVDVNCADCPKMIEMPLYEKCLCSAVATPFRVNPYFDPGVWGGQWMKEVCKLEKEAPNYAWCFDCVPEENSVSYRVNDLVLEFPAIDLVLLHPMELLGKNVYNLFGAEFPIRFDLLDTMGGGKLSLQVHPDKNYIKEQFNMAYTQDESYYVLDAGADASVYLGVKTKIEKEEMIADLKVAQQEQKKFDADHYVNQFPAKKHDHFLIPAGTVHCSGANTMVLEISATPYIFTFKLWDWGRMGLDGKPRSINIEHGEKVIQWDRDEAWVRANLINQCKPLRQGDGYVEEQTGLHALEPIETKRTWFTKSVAHDTNGSVTVFNLVEGSEAEVISPTNQFDPYLVHFAETVIIPAQVGAYIIRPTNNSQGETLATIKATIRE